MQVRLQRRGERITLDKTQVLGSGGQARVFPVEAHPEWAAKVYHKPDFRHAAKLAVMVADPPEDPMAARGHASIAWPLDLLVDSAGTVVGFLMPRVNGTRPIIDYFSPKTRRKACPGFNYFYLLRTARNLAAALHAIHSRGYVIGDVNETNILVSLTALVTLVDTDSFQVYDHGSGECYRCPVGRLEYSAPEVLARVGQGFSYASLDRATEQDLFGLAVLIFQLLMEGTHPFAGVYKGRAEAPTYSERILAGHFAYYQGREMPYEPSPVAPPFALLHPYLQRTFIECFVEGQNHPAARHGALAWVRLLDQLAREVIYCKANSQHVYWPHLKSCPWCARATKLGGRDPFPALTSAPPPSAVEAPVASEVAAKTATASPPIRVQLPPLPIERPSSAQPSQSTLRRWVASLPLPATLSWRPVLPWVGAGAVVLAVVAGTLWMQTVENGTQRVAKPKQKRLEAARVSASSPSQGDLFVQSSTNTPVSLERTSPRAATKYKPWTNSLGMAFVPVPQTRGLFCIWETRVKDYKEYVAVSSPADGSWRNPGFAQADTHPVVKVSWEDAKAFCRWLTEKERREGIIGSKYSYQLPRDWEWSVAVGLTESGGGTPENKDERIPDVYPWGRQWPPPYAAGNYDSSLGVDIFEWTSPVGSFESNRLGLYDLGGNVSEWCEDEYSPGSGDRVLRGAAWSDNKLVTLLSSCRFHDSPGGRYNNYGFRCVLVSASSP
jgi:serine/threonine protein kinase